MATYNIPPDPQPANLVSGDFVNVGKGGVVKSLLVVPGSHLNIMDEGRASNITINGIQGNLGTEIVSAGGHQVTTTVNNFGQLDVFGQVSATTVNTGGLLNVFAGTAIATTLQGGTEIVYSINQDAVARDVSFGGPHQSILELAAPTGLRGTITGFQVGDVIEFLNTQVTIDHVTNKALVLDFGAKQSVTYFLAQQQPNTRFMTQDDGHGGTNLILTATSVMPPSDGGGGKPVEMMAATEVQALHESGGMDVVLAMQKIAVLV